MDFKKTLLAASIPLLCTSGATLAAESNTHGMVDVGVDDGDLNGQFQLYYSDEDNTKGFVGGTNLNSDARQLEMQYGRQGSYRIELGYDEIQLNGNDGALTPFSGKTTLTLPPTWTRLDADGPDPIDPSITLNSAGLETKRKRLHGKVTWYKDKHWDLSLSYRRDRKEGLDRIGGAIGDTSGGDPAQLVSNLGASILPEPIDEVTDRAEITLNYQQKEYQLRAALLYSRYENEYSFLNWENPFEVDVGAADLGQMSLSPSNHFYQFSFSGGYQITPTTRFSGMLSSGVMLQDEAFLPYTVNGTLAPSALPRDSLDGEVMVNALSMRLTSRPARGWRLKAAYRYNERDNNTPQATYTPVTLDYEVAGQSFTNQPYSYRKHKVDASAFYRLNPSMDLGLEYDYDQVKRWQSEVEKSSEHTLGGVLNFGLGNNLDGRVSLHHGKRDGGTYTPYSDPDTTTNPLLRKYHIADRKRNDLGLSLAYSPSENLTLSGGLNLIQDDYDDTQVGMTESREMDASIDLAYRASRNTTLYAFYNHGVIKSEQAGSESGGSADWFADTKDRFNSLGIGFKTLRILPNLDIGADLTLSKSIGDTRITDATAGPTSISHYPDLTTDYKSLQVFGRYRWRKGLYLRMSYLHQEYDSSNWAFDGIDPDSLNNVLLLGEESPNSSDDILALSLIYYFR
jgi:MtrB/PioB family decaheme-associated outer membrane protein